MMKYKFRKLSTDDIVRRNRFKNYPGFYGTSFFNAKPIHVEKAYLLNIPDEIDSKPGTIQILFYDNAGVSYDLHGHEYGALDFDPPKGCDTVPIKFKKDYSLVILEDAFKYGCYSDFSFFRADNYMKDIFEKTGIEDAERKFSILLARRFYGAYLLLFQQFRTHSNELGPTIWKVMEKRFQRDYLKICKLAIKCAEKYQKTGKPNECDYLDLEVIAKQTFKNESYSREK